MDANRTTTEDDLKITEGSLDKALEKAGENRSELQSAIDACQESNLESKCIKFLITNMSDADLKTIKCKLLLSNIRLAIKARNENAWSANVPEDIFLNDVLPYASINETREQWRADFHSRFKELVADCKTAGEAAQVLNQNVFRVLKVKYSTKRKKADQSPSESMETGLASCTGLSVILTDACRSVGVPARLAGTPLWVNKRGNHTWVEIWDEGQWKFTGACEFDPNGLNRGWFAEIASQADPAAPIHRIYATSFKKTNQHFPMVWKRNSKEVSAVDVTWRYIGKPKPKATGEVTVAFKVLSPEGKRIATSILITNKLGNKVGQGLSRTEKNDANDFYEANLKPGTYKVRVASAKKQAKPQKDSSETQSKTLEVKISSQPNQVIKIEFSDQ